MIEQLPAAVLAFLGAAKSDGLCLCRGLESAGDSSVLDGLVSALEGVPGAEDLLRGTPYWSNIKQGVVWPGKDAS